jgi:ribosomal protein L11 methylase PrmA
MACVLKSPFGRSPFQAWTSRSRQEQVNDSVKALAGSFRDPSGFVSIRDGVVYRHVNECYRLHYEHFTRSGLAEDLMGSGLLIPSEEIPTASTGQAPYKVLRTERIPFISYPYEWSFSQLRDAALLTLRVQKRALKFGMSLKDASAYNVQFYRGRAVFIDTLSFEVYVEGRPWVAYRQFCEHFLAPLALMAAKDIRLSQLFRVFMDGIPLDLASKLLPLRSRLKPSLAMHVHLHARAQRRYADRRAVKTTRQLSRAALLGLLDNLAGSVRALHWAPVGDWSEYYSDTNYTQEAIAEKERLVASMLERLGPSTVWDLGANTGRFSRLASSKGILTMAFDADPGAVEKNYLANGSTPDGNLLPLVVDFTNPSPNMGWAGAERLSLQARGPADVALALALVHHLAIGNNVPFLQIAAWLSTLAKNVVIEFVPKSDSQVQRMLASREDIFPDYSSSAFEDAFGRHFAMNGRADLGGSGRVLYEFRRS